MSLNDRVDKHRNDTFHAGSSHLQYTLVRTVQFGTPHHVSTWKVATDHSINFSKEPLPTEWERVRTNVSIILHDISEAHYTRSPKTHDSGRILQSFVWFPPAVLFPNFCGLESEAVSEDPWNASAWSTKRNGDGPALPIPFPSQFFRHLLKFSRLSSFLFVGNYDLDDASMHDSCWAFGH
ncbi:uncharacterized protein F5147DRAFT_757173 [Suillus discolor]|uniref:Uncharacterized protein n=1 Tax=Suillus discolor TaxID=1912936 RepID=A0A9P7FHE8_9AGAM|nr:uncharacterized protein F5147DRAFT_757173 [Suillus discolor]KAG2118696.1 hypothetical protein F5147DRAFT_757173 [Suillus discolor]